MNDMGALGEMLGKAMAKQGTVNVHVPEVSVTVDAAPLADAVRAGHDLNAKALEGVGAMFADAMCKSLGNAVRDIEVSDLGGMEAKIAGLVDATGASGALVAAALQELRSDIAANTAAANRVALMVRDLAAAMMMPKRVTYDEQGRITMVGVG